MTTGHKHRIIKVKGPDTLFVRVLSRPLFHCRSRYRMNRSPYPYGPCALSSGSEPTCWTLSLLGILHRWTGLTLFYPDGP